MPFDYMNESGDGTGWFIDRATGDAVYLDQNTEVVRIDKATRAMSWANGTQTVERTEKVSLTAAEIGALAASPKELVAAQGANKVIEFVSAYMQLNDDGTDYDDAASDGDLVIKHVDGDGVAVSAAIDGDGFIDATAEAFARFLPIAVATGTVAQLENTALVLDNNGAEFTTGTRTAEVFVTYRVHDVS